MLTFYYAKGTSALAAHILLEEVGARYEAVEIALTEGAHKTEAFRRINPKARVPVLVTSEGVISENPAILTYLAATHPDAGMLPEGAFARAEADALNAYLCSTMHVAYAHKFRGARWSDDPAVIEALTTKVAANLAECAALIEGHFLRGPWALGDQFTLCDAYLALVPGWLSKAGVDVQDYPKLAAHRAALRVRPAAARVIAHYGG